MLWSKRTNIRHFVFLACHFAYLSGSIPGKLSGSTHTQLQRQVPASLTISKKTRRKISNLCFLLQFHPKSTKSKNMLFRLLTTAPTGTARSILGSRSALSTSAVCRAEQSPALAPKRPVGAFRGGWVLSFLSVSEEMHRISGINILLLARIIGFLLGLTFTGGYAYLNLLEEYGILNRLPIYIHFTV